MAVTRSRIRWLAMAWLVLPAWAAFAQVGIQPAYVEVDLRAGRPAGRFIISNLGEAVERFRVNAIHFTYDPGGALKQSRDGNHSMAPWIIFNPKELVLPPKSKRAVRFAVVPREELHEGEYWAAMELESLKRSEALSEDPNGRKVKIKVVATIMVPIFGTVGEVDYRGRVSRVALQPAEGKPELAAVLTNTGNGRIGARGTYQLVNGDGEVVSEGPIGRAYVMRDCSRRFAVTLDPTLPDGRYVAKVRFEADHLAAPLTAEAKVQWDHQAAKATLPGKSDAEEHRPPPQKADPPAATSGDDGDADRPPHRKGQTPTTRPAKDQGSRIAAEAPSAGDASSDESSGMANSYRAEETAETAS